MDAGSFGGNSAGQSLTFRVYLSQVSDATALDSFALDQVPSLNGDCSHHVLPRRVFLDRDNIIGLETAFSSLLIHKEFSACKKDCGSEVGVKLLVLIPSISS